MTVRLVLALALVFGGWPALWIPNVVLSGWQTSREPAAIVIPLRTHADQWICAEYESGSSLTREPNRSCKPASLVRDWLLANGPQPECH